MSRPRGRPAIPFLGLVAVGAVAIVALQPFPAAAGLLGFALAARSAIGNDSMQTLGTFIASNRAFPWWALAGFISAILIAVHVWGWCTEDGEIAFGRLDRIPLPERLSHLQLAAPLVLLVLTRYGIPVSTTFLLISVFSGNAVLLEMVEKSLIGYGFALLVGLAAWCLLARVLPADRGAGYPHRPWRIVQWCSTTLLWSLWLMHDTANVAVFLPRTLNPGYLLVALLVLSGTVFAVMHQRGGRIQQIVEDKSATDDIRAATLVDLVYSVILLVFKQYTSIPMSTTWVFLGLLAGRQFAISLARRAGRSALQADLRMAGSDLLRATIGLLVSVALALLGRLL